MQGRQPVDKIDITTLSKPKKITHSFLLFNFLTTHPSPIIDANQHHNYDETAFTLSHSLKRVDPSLDTPYNTSIYFEVGNNEGRLYLLALGVCYYEPPMRSPKKSKKITINYLYEQVDALTDFEAARCRMNKTFISPLSKDIDRLREDIIFLEYDKTNDFDLSLPALHRRILFYQNQMLDAQSWHRKAIDSSEFYQPEPSPILNHFMASTLGVDYFPAGYAYPFQKHQIVFQQPLVKRKHKRKRKKENNVCIDILEATPTYGDAELGIYRVVNLFSNSHREKIKPKHERLYKISQSDTLKDEYKRTKRFAPYLGPRNFHPHLFSERECGKDLIDYCKQSVRKLMSSKATMALFIEEMLKISYLAFQGLAEVMKNEVHGDIKPENLLVISPDSIKPIDFERRSKFTYLYASPERLRSETLTPKSDVWSLMRSLVSLWGDNHEIWEFFDPNPENNAQIESIILANDLVDLLYWIRVYLTYWEKKKYISSEMKEGLFYLFVKGHAFEAKDRLSASECAEKFKALYDAFMAEKNKEANNHEAVAPYPKSMVAGL